MLSHRCQRDDRRGWNLARDDVLLLTGARTNEYTTSQAIDNAAWPASPITDEQIADAVVDLDLFLYGNSYHRPDGTRVSPLRVRHA